MRLAAGALIVLLAAGSIASAKTTREYAYPYDPVWSALVRFLRVDEGLKVLEKDADTGYILFELVESKRSFRGAAEVMRQEGATRVVMRLTDRPSYMELGLLDRFADKLREELGDPLPPSTPSPPSPPADAGPRERP